MNSRRSAAARISIDCPGRFDDGGNCQSCGQDPSWLPGGNPKRKGWLTLLRLVDKLKTLLEELLWDLDELL